MRTSLSIYEGLPGRSRTIRYSRIGLGTTRSRDNWPPDVSVPQLLPVNPASMYLKEALFHSIRYSSFYLNE